MVCPAKRDQRLGLVNPNEKSRLEGGGFLLPFFSTYRNQVAIRASGAATLGIGAFIAARFAAA